MRSFIFCWDLPCYLLTMTHICLDTAIDFSHLRRFVGEDSGLTAELFGLFQHQADMWGKALKQDADDELWLSIAHSLKGSANAVGAIGLADCCHMAEQLVGDKATPVARSVAVQDIQNWIAAVSHRIQRWEYREKLNHIRNTPVSG